MALQRLRESFSIQLSPETGLLNESTNLFGIRLIEKFPVGEGRIVEDSKGNKYKGLACYRVPVSKFTKNANGRVYPKGLWENVIKNQSGIWEGGPGLANHPGDDEDGDVAKQFCVWSNVGINEATQMVESDMTLLDDDGLGKKANAVLEAGGKVGLSTSGYGELQEDKSTVDAKSFMLERVSDWVLNPSQGVFGEIGMKKRESKVKESSKYGTHQKTCDDCGREFNLGDEGIECGLSGENHYCGDCQDNHQEEINMDESVKNTTIRENTTMEKAEKTKLSKAEIRSFKENVERYLGEALTILDPQDRLDELTDIHAYFDDMDESVLPEVRAELEKKIVESKEEITVAIKEHTKLAQTFGVKEVEALKEGVLRVSEDTLLFQHNADEWKAIAEGLQDRVQKLQAIMEARPTVDAYKTALNFAKKLKEDIESRELVLEQARNAMESTLKKEILIQKQLKEQIALLEKSNEELTARNKKLREHASNLSEEIKTIRRLAIQEAVDKKKETLNENLIVIAPKGRSVATSLGFNESVEIKEYYEDLVAGDPRVKAIKERILGCKTVKEASRLVFNHFANKGIGIENISEALDTTERQQMFESQGVKIDQTRNVGRRLPATWE